VRFRILGPVEAWAGEERLTLGGPRQVALLTFLLLHANRAVSSDALIEEVWGPDRSGAAKRLSVAIARLRRALEPLDGDGPPVLRTVAGGYMLSLSAGQLDAEEFGALVKAGQDALHDGQAARAGDLLRAALALWRGPALADVGFENFAQAEIRRLEELRRLALEARIDADLQLGAGADLIGELEALLSLYPTHEHLAGQLMLALYRSGRQAEALEVYQRTRTHLTTELGLEPGPALRALEAQILEQAPAIAERVPGAEALHQDRAGPGDMVTMVIAGIDTPEPSLAELDGSHHQAVCGLRELLRQVWGPLAGAQVADCEDGVLAVFESPQVALEGAQAARDAPTTGHWLPAGDMRIRIGVHTGRLRTRGGIYWGEDVQYAARVAGAAHGGQVLVTAATAAVTPDAALIDLGEHRLTDFAVPRRLFGLGAGPHRMPRTGSPWRTNLPSTQGELIGRDGERAELVAMLRTGQSRLVSITGSGGSGKTSLALAAAAAVVEDLPDGVFFVALAQVREPSAVAAAIAAPLGIYLPPGADAVEALGQAVADRRLLLVLDNFEHLLEAAPLIADLLIRTRELRVMLTSQAPLRIRGERVLALGPLELPDGDDQASVLTAAASRLLLERVRGADPSFELNPENAGSVAQLCRALGGLPLAIELAAARLTLLSPQALLARLDDGIEAVGHGARDLPERQRGLRAALDWTHRLLNEDQARLLRSLGTFAGPVSLERIEQVCASGPDWLDALAHLVDLSLVTRAGDGRFLLHAGVRGYAREKLAAAGETHDLRRRHCEAFAEAADVWGHRFLFNVGEVQSAVLREEADIEQALTWAASADQESFARLAGGVSMVLMFAARLPPWAGMIERALVGTEVTYRARTWLLLAGSLVAFQRQDVHLGCGRLANTVATAEQTGDPYLAGLMRTCSIIFNVLSGTAGDVREDYRLLSRRLTELGDAPELATLVEGLEPYILGYVEGRYDEAGLIWSELMADPTRTDFAGWTALYCWPDCALLSGDYQTALDGYRAALRGARERSQSPTVAYQLEGIAMALAGLDRHEEAIEAAGWADSVRQTAGPAVNRWYKEKLDGVLRESRAALAAEAAMAAYARGRALTLDGAVNAGLEITRTVTRS
jgi:predicted ATPase/DNA-binding SARP family transcriptional activator